jgi:hypothetical protein
VLAWPERADRRTRSGREASYPACQDDADTEEVVVDQVIQVVGALAILLAYVLAQLRVLDQHALPYLALNFAGAFVLAILAYLERQWGFLLLEGVWAAVSAWALLALARVVPRPRA